MNHNIYSDTPKAVSENFVTKDLGTEVLVYDLVKHQAVNLNEPVSCIWNLCDGERTVAQIKEAASRKLKSQLTEDYILFTLSELDSHNLLIKSKESDSLPNNPMSGLSRREAIRRIGITTVVALPLVTALTVPKAADAASLLPLNATCTGDPQCLSTCCQAVCVDVSNCTF